MTTTQTIHRTSEAAIFGRLWDGSPMTTPVAYHLLAVRFRPEDETRMRNLAERCSGGRLTAAEREEYDNFIRVGDLLAILHSKARLHLKQPPANQSGPG